MDVRIYPSRLDGIIEATSSKAMAHRLFIAAALADSKTEIYLNTRSADVTATIGCLKSMGASVVSDGDYYTVTPVWENLNKSATLDIGESVSALRFLLPVAAAIGENMSFSGIGKTQIKSLSEYIFYLKGCAATRDNLPFTVKGRLVNGEYRLKSQLNSQFLCGLSFALPLLKGDSEIIFADKIPQSEYADMTFAVLEEFGIKTEKRERGYFIPGGQGYRSPVKTAVDGDYSIAAYYMAADAFGNRVRVTGLQDKSGRDCAVVKKLLLAFNAKGTVLDLKNNSDLMPILAVCACYSSSETVIRNVYKHRLKETDRTDAMVANLNKLGGKAFTTPDGLRIEGTNGLKGGAIVDSFGDARIAMAMAFAATLAEQPVTLLTAQAVNKVYSGFFNDFAKLGGKLSVL